MKRIYLGVLAMAIASGNVAQNTKSKFPTGDVIPAVWNSNTPTKGFVIFTEDFASGIPATWNNVTTSGPVDWKYTTVGHEGDFPTPALQSASAFDGWAIIDSDNDNFSGGGPEDSKLTTPVIDCSGFTNVKVEFQQMFRRWQADITTIRVTTDGGTTFTDFVINSAITQTGTDNPDFVNIDISSAIAASPATVQVQFWWQGAWDYGWQIDDVSVKEIDANDLLIKRAQLSAGVTYYKTPVTQIQPMSYHSFVENVGYTDQTNVNLSVDVSDGTSSVFTGSSIAVANLAVGVIDSLPLTADFTPSGIGSYAATFMVDQTETDDDASNNSKVLNFEVTQGVYAIDDDVYAGQWWNLDASSTGSDAFEIGALYEMINSDKTPSMSVFIGDNTGVGAVIEASIYEYNITDGTTIIVESTDSYDITAGDLGSWVDIPWYGYVILDPAKVYFVSVKHFGGTIPVYIGYGSNPSAGAALSNDGDGSAWSGQPRAAMIRLNVDNGLGLSKEIEQPFVMAPNPSSSIVSIQFQNEVSGSTEVTILDAMGKLVASKEFANSNSKLDIDVSNLASGIYSVKVVTAKGATTEQLIVK
ncbi:MAG: hypothetical protein ACI8Q1_002185 [Parvicella sp.]|jgi:hypothetical protein